MFASYHPALPLFFDDTGCGGQISYAAVIDTDAPLLHTIDAVPKAWCIVMGNEDTGISPEVDQPPPPLP